MKHEVKEITHFGYLQPWDTRNPDLPLVSCTFTLNSDEYNRHNGRTVTLFDTPYRFVAACQTLGLPWIISLEVHTQ